MSSHVFVDETKRSGYVLAAVTVPDPVAIRKLVRGLVLPGQRRIHLKREHDAARRYLTELAARAGCLAALVEDLVAAGGGIRLVIEQDDSLVCSDRHELYRLVRRPSCATRSTTTTNGRPNSFC